MAKKDLIFDDPFYEEYDDISKGLNSPNSLLSFYLPQILSNYHSSEKNPITQQKIIQILEEYPYDLTVDRKTVGRTLRTLEVYAHAGIHTSSSGSWYDPRDDWFTMKRPGKMNRAA